eukprot:Nk52_evm48s230 gene=Nk52_evmTU48s230
MGVDSENRKVGDVVDFVLSVFQPELEEQGTEICDLSAELCSEKIAACSFVNEIVSYERLEGICRGALETDKAIIREQIRNRLESWSKMDEILGKTLGQVRGELHGVEKELLVDVLTKLCPQEPELFEGCDQDEAISCLVVFIVLFEIYTEGGISANNFSF